MMNNDYIMYVVLLLNDKTQDQLIYYLYVKNDIVKMFIIWEFIAF